MSDHMKDHKGRLVPVDQIRPIDLARHDVVLSLVQAAKVERDALATLKKNMLDDLSAFVQLSAEEYGVTLGGTKGNLTLMSFDHRYKVARQISDFLTFDERLQVAKELIDTCIREWAEGADGKIRALVEHAFQVDKAGKVSTERVLGLRRINIEDERWAKAMQAISDSLQIAASKTYVRLYERDEETDEWHPISLDLASVEAAS